LKIKDKIITLVPSGNSLPRLLNLTTRTIKRPTRTLLQNPTAIIISNNNIITVLRLTGSVTIPVEQRSFSIVNNVTGDVPSFSIQLPDTNPGKAHTPTPIHRTPLHLFLTCLFHKLLPPVPGARAPITPRENTLPHRHTILPKPLVTVPIRPHQNPLPRNHTTPPLPHVLVAVPPPVPPLPLLQVAPPPTFIDIPITVSFLAEPVLSVGHPGPSVHVAVDADKGSEPVYPTRLEFPLVGGAGGPRESPLAASFPLSPLPLVHAPIGPEVLPGAVRRVPRQGAAVDVAVRQRLLPDRTHAPRHACGGVGAAAATVVAAAMFGSRLLRFFLLGPNVDVFVV